MDLERRTRRLPDAGSFRPSNLSTEELEDMLYHPTIGKRLRFWRSEEMEFDNDDEFPGTEIPYLSSYENIESRLFWNGSYDWVEVVSEALSGSSRTLQKIFQTSISRRILRTLPIRQIYECLPTPNSFRIFQLDPSCEFDAPLSGNLRISTWEVNPSYFALSYVWGDPNSTVGLLCNGRALQVTRNLRDALRQIRSRHQVLDLWIDAICIDQSNFREKSEQVQNMGLIYRKAKRVIVWFGYDGGTEGYVFRGAKNIVANTEFREGYFTSWRTEKLTRGLRMLTSVEWFRRIWTCQEIGLAAQATIYYGCRTIDWDTLYTAFKIIEDRIGIKPLRQINFDTEIITRLYRSYNNGTFKNIFYHTRSRKSTEPKDKVYALLSHISATEPLTGEPKLQVDYSKPLSRVYAEAAVMMMKEQGNLDDIIIPSGGDIFKDLWPSWLPQWHTNNISTPLWVQNSACRFNANGKYSLDEVELEMSTGGVTSIRLSGFEIDTIQAIVPIRGSPHYRVDEESISKTWMSIIELSQKYYGTSAFKALLLCLDATCSPLREVDSRLEDKWNSFWVEGSQQRCVPVRSLIQFESELFRDYTNYAYQQIFVTNRGLVGIGSSDIDEGDTVVILCGGRVPFLLSKSTIEETLKYRVAGMCHIASLMQGEVEQMVAGGEISLKLIEIF